MFYKVLHSLKIVLWEV